jgi:hypothetical protein
MSAFIFGRIYFPEQDSSVAEELLKLIVEKTAGLGICVTRKPDIPNHHLIDDMLLSIVSAEPATVTVPFVLVERTQDTVSDGLIHNTPLLDPARTKIDLRAFSVRLANFLRLALENGAKRVDLFTSIGFSIPSDFSHIVTNADSASHMIFSSLVDEPELPSLWIECR